MKTAAEALEYAGLMGHKFILLEVKTSSAPSSPVYDCRAECTTIEAAQKEADELHLEHFEIWEQVVTGSWRMVYAENPHPKASEL